MLAVMMIFGLCTVTAFADGEGETPDSPTTPTVTFNGVEVDGPNDGTGVVTITKSYRLENDDTTNPAEKFYLIQSDKTSDESSVTGTDIPDLVLLTDSDFDTAKGRLVGIVEFGKGDATVAGAEKNFQIGLPEYTAVGIYTYILNEIDNGTAGVTYFTQDITLVITVMANDDGSFYVSAVHCETPIDVSNENGTKTDKFENVYAATSTDPADGGLNFTKTVSGNLGDRDKYFEFTVTFTPEAGKDYSDAVIVTVNGGSHADNPTEVDLTSGTEQTVTFYLKHNETIRFGNVPYGMTYSYVETVAGKDGYTTTYPTVTVGTGEIDPETNEEITTTADDLTGTINFAAKNYTVNNEKNKEIDTGISIDDLPYIMALAVVLIGGVVFFVSKKRIKAEDRV